MGHRTEAHRGHPGPTATAAAPGSSALRSGAQGGKYRGRGAPSSRLTGLSLFSPSRLEAALRAASRRGSEVGWVETAGDVGGFSRGRTPLPTLTF